MHAGRRRKHPARLACLAAAALSGLAAAGPGRAQDAETALVAVLSIAIDAGIQAVIDGMGDRLAQLGHAPGKTIAIEVAVAGPDRARARELADEYARRNARVIVAITRPALVAALDADARTPVVGARISMETAEAYRKEHRRRPLTGIARGATRDDQFELIRRLAPATRTVAVPIDPAGGDVDARLRDLAASGRERGISVEALPVSIQRNAISGRIDDFDPASSAILLDRGLFPDAPVESLAAVANERGLPMFADDEDSVIRGASAAMVVEPYDIGLQLGTTVARILDDPDAARLPFQRARATHLVLNQEADAVLDVAAAEREPSADSRSVIDWEDVAGPHPRLKPSAPEEPAPFDAPAAGGTPVPRPGQ